MIDMNSKERMRLVMNGQKPDRTPVMCQLAGGHIYKNLDIAPIDYWYTSQGRAEGYIQMAQLYNFDGILVTPGTNGIDPSLKNEIKEIINLEDGHKITWKSGKETIIPPDDSPRDINAHKNKLINISDLSESEITTWGQEPVPEYFLDQLNYVLERKGKTLSIHGEVGTVFEKFLEQLGSFENGLMALIDNPSRCLEFMSIMNQRIIRLAIAQCETGIDALKLSSPLAGAGFISSQQYETFVLPFEKKIIEIVHKKFKTPCYIHTCGAIGDRLDMMIETGTDGLECLDPPPLGTVHLEEAIDSIGEKVWIKGNLDSVNELTKEPEEIRKIARKRIEIGRKAKGYILSSACSVSPKVPPENIKVLYEVVTAQQKHKETI